MMTPTPAALKQVLLYVVGGGLLLVVLVGGAVYGYRTWQRGKTVQRTEATIAAEAAHRAAADSAYFFNLGRHYEVQRQLDSLNHHAEHLSIPADYALPAEPPRQ